MGVTRNTVKGRKKKNKRPDTPIVDKLRRNRKSSTPTDRHVSDSGDAPDVEMTDESPTQKGRIIASEGERIMIDFGTDVEVVKKSKHNNDDVLKVIKGETTKLNPPLHSKTLEQLHKTDKKNGAIFMDKITRLRCTKPYSGSRRTYLVKHIDDERELRCSHSHLMKLLTIEEIEELLRSRGSPPAKQSAKTETAIGETHAKAAKRGKTPVNDDAAKSEDESSTNEESGDDSDDDSDTEGESGSGSDDDGDKKELKSGSDNDSDTEEESESSSDDDSDTEEEPESSSGDDSDTNIQKSIETPHDSGSPVRPRKVKRKTPGLESRREGVTHYSVIAMHIPSFQKPGKQKASDNTWCIVRDKDSKKHSFMQGHEIKRRTREESATFTYKEDLGKGFHPEVDRYMMDKFKPKNKRLKTKDYLVRDALIRRCKSTYYITIFLNIINDKKQKLVNDARKKVGYKYDGPVRCSLTSFTAAGGNFKYIKPFLKKTELGKEYLKAKKEGTGRDRLGSPTPQRDEAVEQLRGKYETLQTSQDDLHKEHRTLRKKQKNLEKEFVKLTVQVKSKR